MGSGSWRAWAVERKRQGVIIKYFWHVLRHKYFVLLEARRLGIPFLGIIHDMSKFRPSEFLPYARYFHGSYPDFDDVKNIVPYDILTKEDVGHQFDYAWLHHQKCNKHHWQYWVLWQDSDEDKILPMPEKYVREMLADWRGAGRAYGNPDTKAWYIAHRAKMLLHPATRHFVENELDVTMDDFVSCIQL